ncbi:MAG: ABC transporter substrate-binding protein [Acidimicrobiia bacterium]
MRSTTTSRRRSRTRAWLAAFAVLALLGAACGGDDDGDEATEDPAGEGSGGSGDEGAEEEEEVEEGLVLLDELVADQELLDAAREEGGLTLYSMTSQEFGEAQGKAFTEDTGVDFTLFRAPSAELTQRVLSENDAGVHAFDVIQQSGPTDMAKFRDLGLLAGYELPVGEGHFLNPDEIQDDFTYFPFSSYVYVPAYNSAVLPDGLEIEDWDDILDPRVKGKVGITPAGVGGTGIGMAAFQDEVLGGDAYLEKLAAADPVIFPSTVTVADGLARGELTTAIVGESVAVTQKSNGAPVELVYPKDGVIGGVSYMGVAAKAENPNAARLFVNWVLSKRGQQVHEQCCLQRTIRDDTPPTDNELVPPTSDIKIWWPNLSSRGDTTALVENWNKIVGYTG